MWIPYPPEDSRWDPQTSQNRIFWRNFALLPDLIRYHQTILVRQGLGNYFVKSSDVEPFLLGAGRQDTTISYRISATAH